MFSSEEIPQIERIIGCKFPENVLTEALNTDSPLWGQEAAPYRFKFLTLKEHRDLQTFIQSRDRSPLMQIPELKILWMDAESNFMGIFVTGPMMGRLALIGHDTNIDCAPLYRDFEKFVKVLTEGFENLEEEWPYPVDYPNTGDELKTDGREVDIERDMACASELEALAASTDDLFRKRFLYSCVCSLVPKEYAAQLVLMLESRDFHVCGRACSMLGYYQFDAACPRMAQIALDANNPARFCAVDGIGLMGTKSSRKILVDLVRIGVPLPGNITAALRRSSFEVSNKIYFRDGKKFVDWYVHLEGGKCENIIFDSRARPSPWWRMDL